MPLKVELSVAAEEDLLAAWNYISHDDMDVRDGQSASRHVGAGPIGVDGADLARLSGLRQRCGPASTLTLAAIRA